MQIIDGLTSWIMLAVAALSFDMVRATRAGLASATMIAIGFALVALRRWSQVRINAGYDSPFYDLCASRWMLCSITTFWIGGFASGICRMREQAEPFIATIARRARKMWERE